MVERSEGQLNKPGEVPQPSLVDTLQPGNVIEFADIAELVAFEEVIASEVDPEYNPVIWASRQALRDLIRPPTFNGTMADIRLEVMADPYDRLLDARERGWKIGRGQGSFRLKSELAEELIPRYRGFTLLANPKSSRPGSLSQIQSELWYYPTPLYVASHIGSEAKSSNRTKSGEIREYQYTTTQDHIRPSSAYHRGEIRRIVARPKMETERFIEHDASARRIGFQVLRQQLMHPISTPMQE
jgi:hypothetical protein